ncbi:MAG: hypothetical protein LUH49_07500, partial [Cloacibacillus porcorum]|uniref:hypothetical protein n=1 Tax=Cloacibacillus porcorum TaxID=1197717 RepID=UPI0023F50D9A
KKPSRPTTKKSPAVYKRLVTLFLTTLILSSTLPTPSSPSLLGASPAHATVTKINDNTVQMSKADLKTLVSEIQTNKAKAEALTEALTSERAIFEAYENSIEQLIAVQQAERESAQAVIKQLQRQLNAPALELYTGYKTGYHWSAGVRLIIKLKKVSQITCSYQNTSQQKTTLKSNVPVVNSSKSARCSSKPSTPSEREQAKPWK